MRHPGHIIITRVFGLFFVCSLFVNQTICQENSTQVHTVYQMDADGFRGSSMPVDNRGDLRIPDNDGKPIWFWDANASNLRIGTFTDYIASGTTFSYAFGKNALATGQNTFAIGDNPWAQGPNTVAIGNQTNAIGKNSVAIGLGSITTADNSVAVGHYNNYNLGTPDVFSVGNGERGNKRHNALTVLADGRTIVSSEPGAPLDNPSLIPVSGATFTVIGAMSEKGAQVSIIDNENPSTSIESKAAIIGYGNDIKPNDILNGSLWGVGSFNGLSNDIGLGNHLNGKIRFQTGSIESVTIYENGNVGIGTAKILTMLPDGMKFAVAGDAYATNWKTSSSIRLKDNIKPIDNALEKVKQLNGVSFTWKDSRKNSVGLIAEEVGEVLPELVSYESNGEDARGLDYDKLTALLIEAVKEQQKQIEQLKARLAAVEGQ